MQRRAPTPRRRKTFLHLTDSSLYFSNDSTISPQGLTTFERRDGLILVIIRRRHSPSAIGVLIDVATLKMRAPNVLGARCTGAWAFVNGGVHVAVAVAVKVDEYDHGDA